MVSPFESAVRGSLEGSHGGRTLVRHLSRDDHGHRATPLSGTQLSPVRLTPLQRAHSRLVLPRTRRFAPLRREALLAREALHERVAHSWTLRELAKTVRLSPQQLSRVFADAYGKTPIAYPTMLRVQEMARLLRETDLPVAATGRQVGWSSRSRATEAFIEHTGLSPSRYRAMRPVGTDHRM